MEHGLPESRALPYVVEIAFNRRDYKTVQDLLLRLSVLQVTPIMKNAIQFWVTRTTHQAPSSAKENSV
jgi:IS1 family transposase